MGNFSCLPLNIFWDDDAILRQKQNASSHRWAELHDPRVILCGQKSNCFFGDGCIITSLVLMTKSALIF